MTGHASLLRLLALRRRNEARALDAVTLAEQAHRQAGQAVANSELAIRQQFENARAREQAMIDTLLGKPAPSHVLYRLQTGLDTLGRTADELREHKTRLEQALAERAEALGLAREEYRLRQRAARKLDLTVERQAKDIARQEAAVAESQEEDQAGGRRGRMGSHQQPT